MQKFIRSQKAGRWVAYLVAAILSVLPARWAAADSPVGLVVVVVIDQLRGDLVERCGEQLSEGGFRRLSGQGAWFRQAHYSYGVLATGPGHATLLTGANPSVHGIVANNWFDRSQGGRRQYCCGDDTVSCIGTIDGERCEGMSPITLRMPTLGDQLKRHTNGKSRVITMSLKDRSAILTGGAKADCALWWDWSKGQFVSSTYYGEKLPSWAIEYNQSGHAASFFGRKWDLLSEGLHRLRPVDGVSNQPAYDRHHPRAFPKMLGSGLGAPGRTYYAALAASPFGNEVLLEAAQRAIEAEQLGRDEHVDLLVIGLSSNDIVGHLYGPDSAEVADCTLRTDQQLERFLDWLDERVGLRRCIVALSSDHGVAPLPEYASDLGLGGGRFDDGMVERRIEKRLVVRYGKPDGDNDYVRNLKMPWLYLDEQVLARRGLPVADAARLAAQAARDGEGVAEAFAEPDIVSTGFARLGRLQEAVFNSHDPQRSGHVYVHWKRYWNKRGNPAGHGAAYDYDQHVPVALMGPGIKPGTYSRRVDPTGLTVTLCALLGVEKPTGATGQVYQEVIASPPAANSPPDSTQ